MKDLDFAFFGKVVGGQCVVGKISDVVYITVAGMLPVVFQKLVLCYGAEPCGDFA